MSHIKVQCCGCSNVHQIDGQEISFAQVGSDEREMGEEIGYEGNIEVACNCGNAIEVSHAFWEYPAGVEHYKETEVRGGTIVENTL